MKADWLLLVGIGLILLACNREKFSQGKRLYTFYCASCHMEDGTGLRKIQPPLVNSDYYRLNLSRVPCIIRYGLDDEILVNKKIYRQKMEGITTLNDIEIANIINYINHAWGNKLPAVSIKDVKEQLENCDSNKSFCILRYQMKTITLFLIFSFYSTSILGQVINSSCNGIINLGTAPYCAAEVFSNISATPFDIKFDNEPSCFINNPPQNDVWFSFKTSLDIQDYTITINSGNVSQEPQLQNIQFALYRGDCAVNSLAVRDCASASEGEGLLSIDVIGLSPGITYFLRIDSYDGDASEGYFTICISEKNNDNTIDQLNSNSCSGVLFDSGGPDMPYSDNENYVFTICPEEVFQCLTVEFEYYNLAQENLNSSDQLIFYEGLTINGRVISKLGSSLTNESAHSGGGVCFTVQSPTCITVQFTSNDQNVAQGFKANWSCSVRPCSEVKSIFIDDQFTNDKVLEALSSISADVKLDTIVCSSGALATFQDSKEKSLGIDKGILLSTGLALDVLGPNTSVGVSTDLQASGDHDLDSLSLLEGAVDVKSFDACVVELDVFTYSNELTFEYIFGSEEYPEFVNSGFNDIFALLISGPGINDGIPQIDNQKNLAKLENGDVPVQVNSVNHLTNWQYYRNNSFSKSIEFDGLTSGYLGQKKSLTARANVIPCNEYHLKFAIADRSDPSFDSGVFISEISSSFPSLQSELAGGINFLVEGCSRDDQNRINLTLSNPFRDTLQYLIEVGGSAENLIDYELNIPEVVKFIPMETEKSFPIIVNKDSIKENEETILIRLLNPTPCDTVLVDEIQIIIKDEVDIGFENYSDSVSICKYDSLRLNIEGAQNYSWQSSLVWQESNTNQPVFFVDESAWIYVTGSLGESNALNCINRDSIFVKAIALDFSMVSLSSPRLCVGDTLELVANASLNDGLLSWKSPFGSFTSNDFENSFIAENQASNQVLSASYQIGECIITDSIPLEIDSIEIPLINIQDTAICLGQSILLGSELINPKSSYHWSPTIALSDPGLPITMAIPTESTSYSLSVESERGYCRAEKKINIRVLQSAIEVNEIDSIRICKGDSIVLSTTSTPISENPFYNWEPSNIIISGQDSDIAYFHPVESSFVIVEFLDSICVSFDTVFVTVDSLPELDIQRFPDKTNYCKDEIISLISSPINLNIFPQFTKEWQSGPGIVSDPNALNIIVRTDTSFTYVRTISTAACYSNDSIFIEVLNPMINILPTDSIICEDQILLAEIASNLELDSIIWNVETDCMTDNCDIAGLSIQNDMEIIATGFSSDCYDKDSITIEVENMNLQIKFEPSGPIPTGSTFSIAAFLTQDPNLPLSLDWYVNGRKLEQSQQELELTFSNEENIIIADYLSSNGCLFSDTLVVTTESFEIDFPNVFSPDAQSTLNQSFRYVIKLAGQYYEDAEFEMRLFSIYNRWGHKVFSCSNKQCAQAGWDGTHLGEELPSDSYIYHFEAILPNGKLISKKGNVLLLK